MSELPSRLTLTSLVPRQVMLETAAKATATTMEDNYKKKKKKDETADVIDVEDEENKIKKKEKKKKSYKVSDASDIGTVPAEALAQDLPRGDSMFRSGRGRVDLLRSIAAFLESSGFSKTLSVFLSEAKIEVNSRGGSCINLEELFDKVIESSKKDPIASIEWSKEQGVLLADTSDDSNAKTKEKKRKNILVYDSIGEENAGKNCLDAGIGTTENTYYQEPLNEEKKKRRKMTLGEGKVRETCIYYEQTKEKLDELNDLISNHFFETVDIEKNKGEKSKKKKRTKDANQSPEQIEMGGNQVEVIADSDGGDNASTKHQEAMSTENLVNGHQEYVDVGKRKKKKDNNTKSEKSTSDSLPTINSDKLIEDTSYRMEKHDKGFLQKSGFKEESIEIANNPTAEKSTNKKRKRSSSIEISVEAENIPVPLNVESEEPSAALSSVVLGKHEEDPSSQDTKKQLNEHQHSNGNVEKKQNDRSTRTKAMKKEKHSEELKAVNAFQRIKVDDVQFADERLQDNSYWALDDSGSGYGAKAQEILGQVRGRDFRHEKTKKKRGSYRGGQIDLQPHSVKFNYSDEE